MDHARDRQEQGEQARGNPRERILEAALQTFAEKGFDGSATREIAARAGVNHGLIPYYFGSKEKLWRASVDRAFQQIESGIGALLRDPGIRDERERASRLIRAHVHFVRQNPEFVRLMHDEGKRRGPRMRWIVDRHVKPMYAAITALLERGLGEGVLRLDIAPVHFFYIVVGASSVIFHQAEECKRVSGVDPFDPQVAEEHARAIELLLHWPPSGPAWSRWPTPCAGPPCCRS